MIDIIYNIFIPLTLLVSIVSSIYIYNTEKHLLVNLSNKLTNGWGLYKIKLLKENNNIILSPYNDERFLYYKANIFYEDKVINEVKSKKKDKLDIKYYTESDEKIIDNIFKIKLFSKEITINSKKINIELNPEVKTDIVLDLGENKTLQYIEERKLVEDKDYFLLINFKNKRPDLKSITITDTVNNNQNNFYFKIGLVWFPSLMFIASFFLL